MALVVAERTDEVGVRVALGATPVRILSMIVGHAVRLGMIGLAIGAAASLVLAQAARNLLFGIGPTDFVTFVAVPAAAAVALVAAIVPAHAGDEDFTGAGDQGMKADAVSFTRRNRDTANTELFWEPKTSEIFVSI